MLLLFLIAGFITAALALVVLAGVIGGIVFFLVPRARVLAPWVFFVPVLAALGAIGGSWGLGYLANEHSGFSSLPLWAWIGGLFLGAAFGAITGGLLAWRLRVRNVRPNNSFKPKPLRGSA